MKETNEIFYKIKNIEYKTIEAQFLLFQKSFKNKSIAARRFMTILSKREEQLVISDIDGKKIIDDFKHYFSLKVNNEFKDRRNILKYIIEELIPQLKKEYNEKMNNELSKGYSKTFDYSYFLKIVDGEYISFLAQVRALVDFKRYLNKLISGKDLYEVQGIILKTSHKIDLITDFYEILSKKGLINVELDDFIIHFEEIMLVDQIQWYGNAPEIIELFAFICSKKQSIYTVIKDHFLDQFGKPFKKSNLYSAISKTSTEKDRINEIISFLKKKF